MILTTSALNVLHQHNSIAEDGRRVGERGEVTLCVIFALQIQPIAEDLKSYEIVDWVKGNKISKFYFKCFALRSQ